MPDDTDEKLGFQSKNLFCSPGQVPNQEILSSSKEVHLVPQKTYIQKFFTAEKLKMSITISSVIVTKSTGNRRYGPIN